MLGGPVVPREVIVAERRHRTGFSEHLGDRWGMGTYFLFSRLADLDQGF